MGVCNLAEWLLRPASASDGSADRIALRAGETSLTYAQLSVQARKIASALSELGLSPGERVAVFMADTLEAATSILGIIYAGGVAVPMPELATAEDLHQFLLHERFWPRPVKLPIPQCNGQARGPCPAHAAPQGRFQSHQLWLDKNQITRLNHQTSRPRGNFQLQPAGLPEIFKSSDALRCCRYFGGHVHSPCARVLGPLQ